MAYYKSTVTNYNGFDDVVTKGLNIEQAVLKVQRNIYGHDDSEFLKELIVERCNDKGRAIFFCDKDTAQVEIKLEV